MFCPGCGQTNAEAARFCTTCGRSLPAAQAEPPAGQAAMPLTPPDTTAQHPIAPPLTPDLARAAPPLFADNAARADMQTQSSPVFQAPPPPILPQATFPTRIVASTPCRVCGVAYSYRSECPRCGTPAGMIVNAGDPTANSYVRVDAPGWPQGPMGAQTSAPGHYRSREPVPAELQSGWNWGAAFMTYPWAIAHRIWWYVALQTILSLTFIGICAASNPNDDAANFITGLAALIYFVICIFYRIYFGVRGNQLAWRNRRFDSANQCLVVQQTWKPAGIMGSIVALLLSSAVVILFIKGMISGIEK